MRLLRRLPLRINLQNRRARNNILIREIRFRFRKYNIRLSRDSIGNGIDLVVFITARDAGFYGEFQQSGEKYGVDGVGGFDAEGLGCGGEGRGECDGGASCPKDHCSVI